MFKDFQAEIKLFVIVVLAAAVLSVGGILLLRGLSQAPISPTPPVIQQTPPPVRSPLFDILDWQTYRSDEFGFEVKYPDGWDAIWDTALVPPGLELRETYDAIFPVIFIVPNMSFEVAGEQIVPTTQEDIEKLLPAIISDLNDVRRETILVNGIPAIKVNGFYSGDKAIGILFIYRGTFYFIVSVDVGDYEKEFDQILSTFRFVPTTN